MRVCFFLIGLLSCPEMIINFPDDGTVVKRMLVGIMSDTHDDIVQTKKAVSKFNREGVEQVLHAGDFISPFMIDTLKELTAPLTGVFGNNDGDRSLLERKSGMQKPLPLLTRQLPSTPITLWRGTAAELP